MANIDRVGQTIPCGVGDLGHCTMLSSISDLCSLVAKSSTSTLSQL